MRINQKTVISTSNVLLVPYEAHHVRKYHAWMQDPDIQEATASEPMTLDEEFENQQSWRTAHDKLTFILCAPLEAGTSKAEFVRANQADANDRMIGDINFFLYPHDNDEDEAEGSLTGEIDIMIAEKQAWGRGIGKAAVCALLVYVDSHVAEILGEHTVGVQAGAVKGLKELMVKIKEGNAGSRALFNKLGFKQIGEVNYFGEVKMIMAWEDLKKQTWWHSASEDHHGVPYSG